MATWTLWVTLMMAMDTVGDLDEHTGMGEAEARAGKGN